MKKFQFRSFLKIHIWVYQIQSYFKNTPKNIKEVFVFCFCICLDWCLNDLIANVSWKVSVKMRMLPLSFQVPPYPLPHQNQGSLIIRTLLSQVGCATRLLADNILCMFMGVIRGKCQNTTYFISVYKIALSS